MSKVEIGILGQTLPITAGNFWDKLSQKWHTPPIPADVPRALLPLSGMPSFIMINDGTLVGGEARFFPVCF